MCDVVADKRRTAPEDTHRSYTDSLHGSRLAVEYKGGSKVIVAKGRANAMQQSA
jgi:hypothetical protein